MIENALSFISHITSNFFIAETLVREAPTQYHSTTRWFEVIVVPATVTASAARTLAASARATISGRTYYGYLATIDSAVTQTFLLGLANAAGGANTTQLLL